MHAWHSHKMRTCLCACVMFVTKITSVYILIKYLCEKGQVYIMICNHSLIIVTIIIYRCLIWLLIPQLLDGYDYICSQCHIIYMIFYGTYTTIASTCACTWLHQYCYYALHTCSYKPVNFGDSSNIILAVEIHVLELCGLAKCCLLSPPHACALGIQNQHGRVIILQSLIQF